MTRRTPNRGRTFPAYVSAEGSGGRAVERRTVNREDGGSNGTNRRFETFHIFLYLSEETLQADGPSYLVSMPGEVK